jgi:hypothetical protein
LGKTGDTFKTAEKVQCWFNGLTKHFEDILKNHKQWKETQAVKLQEAVGSW